jgi:O-antigen/teichoic acid export membrane protein
VISASVSINIPIGIAGTLILFGTAGWLVRDVLLIPEAAREKTVLALYLAAGILFCTMLSQMFNAVLQGLHRFDVFSRLFNINNGLLLGGNAVLAYSGYGLNVLLAWNLIVLTVMALVGAAVAKRLVPEFRLRVLGKNPELRKILMFSAGIIGYQLLSNGLLLFERGWLMRKLGPETVAYYVVPLTLGIQLHGFVASLMLVIFPLTSELGSDLKKLKRMYSKATKLSLLLVFFIAASIFVQGRVFLALWLGREFSDASWLLLSIHTATFSMLAVQVVAWQMNEGLGRTAYNFAVTAVSVSISAVLMVALTSGYAETGVAFGRLAGYAAIFASVFVIERRIFGSIDAGFWLRTAGTLLAASSVAALAEFAVLSALPANWAVLFVSTIAGFIAYGAIVYLLGLITEDEKILLRGLATR